MACQEAIGFNLWPRPTIYSSRSYQNNTSKASIWSFHCLKCSSNGFLGIKSTGLTPWLHGPGGLSDVTSYHSPSFTVPQPLASTVPNSPVPRSLCACGVPLSIKRFPKISTELTKVAWASAQILPLWRGLPSHVNHTRNTALTPFPEEYALLDITLLHYSFDYVFVVPVLNWNVRPIRSRKHAHCGYLRPWSNTQHTAGVTKHLSNQWMNRC